MFCFPRAGTSLSSYCVKLQRCYLAASNGHVWYHLIGLPVMTDCLLLCSSCNLFIVLILNTSLIQVDFTKLYNVYAHRLDILMTAGLAYTMYICCLVHVPALLSSL